MTAVHAGNYVLAHQLISTTGEALSLDMPYVLVRGMVAMGMKDWHKAHEIFSSGYLRHPNVGILAFNLAVTLETFGHSKEALTLIEKSLSLGLSTESYGAACLTLSNIHRKMGQFDLAEQAAREGIGKGTDQGEAHNCLGLALWKKGLFEQADQAFLKAISFHPNHGLFWLNRANLAVDHRRYDDSWIYYVTARSKADTPTARRDEGMAHLLVGEFKQGWPLYESRLELPNAFHPPHRCPRYNGEPLQGKKLLVMAEQGFGDVIHFCRYEKVLMEAGADIAWVVQEPLVRLLQENLRGHVFAQQEIAPQVDFYLPMMSIPFAMKDKCKTEGKPYIKPPAKGPSLPSASSKKKIGLVWSGSPKHERDFERSIPFNFFNPLFNASHEADYYCIQSMQMLFADKQMVDLSYFINDFGDTAFLLAQLDLLITADTATAHLAGAMGKPAILLLPYCPDWRWGTEGEKTPLYDSVTLIRQNEYGNWADVIERLINQHRDLIGN